MTTRLLLVTLPLAAAALLAACGREPETRDGSAAELAAEGPEPPRPAATNADSADLVREDRAADSIIAMERITWARRERLDMLPTGALMAALGHTFVGTPYIPQTLEVGEQEHLVINLRALDCVTFVENMLALARTVKAGGGFPEFTRELQRVRYRTGAIAGYPSRLHYFSEWIDANEQKGLVTNITRELGGVRNTEPLNFMSQNRAAYRQLTDEQTWQQLLELERRLSARPRYWIPEDRIAAVAPAIRDGDIIAATSAVPGLDVVHTGLAIWLDDALHLMHAPLVGDSVEVSERPLAIRIQRIESQDGIMVARPR